MILVRDSRITINTEPIEPIHVDINFIREAAEIFVRFDLPLTWHVRIGVEFPSVAAPSEFVGHPRHNPSKLFRKTLNVGSPDEMGNGDLLSVDKATGLRIVTSQVHLPFLAGQRLLLTDQNRATLLEAIRQRKARDQSVISIKKSSDQEVRKTSENSAAKNNERENVIRLASSNKMASSTPTGEDQKG